MERNFWKSIAYALLLVGVLAFVIAWLPYLLAGLVVALALLLLVGLALRWWLRRKWRQLVKAMEAEAQSQHFQQPGPQTRPFSASEGPVIHVQAEEVRTPSETES